MKGERDYTARLPRDAKGNIITIGDRVWYMQLGVSLNGTFPKGYTPIVAVCDILVGGVTETTVIPANGTNPGLLAIDCYTDIRDCFNAVLAVTARPKLEATA